MKINFFLCDVQVYPNITFSFNFSEIFISVTNFEIFSKNQNCEGKKLHQFWKWTIDEEKLFSLSPLYLPKYHIFVQFFWNFYSLQLSQNFNFLTKTKTATAHSNADFENTINEDELFVYLIHIYLNITFSSNFLEIFITLFNLAKISILNIENALNPSFLNW